MSFHRRGYLRAVESLIAIIMILAVFQVFVNWGMESTSRTVSTRQTGYDILAAYEQALPLVLKDFFSFDQFISYAVPSSFNYKLAADLFIPVTLGPDASGEIFVDFPTDVDPASIRLSNSTFDEQPVSSAFNFYRIPFFVTNNEAGAIQDAPIYVAFSLPKLDANGDGIADPADKNSLDLYFDGKRVPFILHYVGDRSGTLLPALIFNATLSGGETKQGYLYFSTGSYRTKDIRVSYTPLDTSSYNVTIVTRPVEKAPRATISLSPSPAGDDGTLFLSARVGSPSPAQTQAYNSSLTFSGSPFFTLDNDLCSLQIDPANGVYSFILADGTRILSGMPQAGAPLVPLFVSSAPRLVNQTQPVGEITAYWQMNSTSSKIDYYATIFEGRTELLIQRKVVPLATSLESETYLLDDFELNPSFDFSPWDSWPRPVGTQEKRSLVFSTGSSDLAMFLDNPSNFSISIPSVRVNWTGNVTEGVPMFSQTLLRYGPPPIQPNSRPVNFFGPDDELLGTSGTIITDVPSDFTFDYMSGRPRPDGMILNFTVNRRFNLTLALSCSLNGRSIFSGIVIPGYRYINDSAPPQLLYKVPPTWLPDGPATVSCAVNSTNLTIESIAVSPLKFSSAEGAVELPVVFKNRGGAQNVRLMLNLTELGLGVSSESDLAVVEPEGGKMMEFSVVDWPSRTINLLATLPANSEKTYSLFIADRFPFPQAAYADDMAVPPEIPIGTNQVYLGDNPLFEVEADIGKVRYSSPTYSLPPLVNPSYVDKSISPTADAVVSQQLVFDAATGRAGVVSLILWRKA